MVYENIIKEHGLFKGLSDKDFAYANEFFGTEIRKYKKGVVIKKANSTMENFGLVLEGQIGAYINGIDGKPVLMRKVNPGESFGESLCMLKKEAGVTVCAEEDTTVLRMSTSRLAGRDGRYRDQRDQMLAVRFMELLAERTLEMNSRIQILNKLSMREKLVAMFSVYSNGGMKKSFELPFDRNEMAEYLGTNRCALSRELSNMKNDGIIDFNKSSFELKENKQ